MTIIGIEEIHRRILDIAECFDSICSKHGIPYYMLGGTMLGAIRHKGFIPWDDDMDFGVPYQYYNELIGILEKELPQGMRCCTYENRKAVVYPFLKIEDTNTVIDDPRINLPINEKLGINIDVFPLATCDKNCKYATYARKLLRLQTLLFVESAEGNKVKKMIKHTLHFLTPFGKEYLPKKMLKLFRNMKSGSDIANIFGRWGIKESVDRSWYGENERYKFENLTLQGFVEYDKYLSQMYGDYMKLPSKDQQTAHVENVFLR